MASTWQRVRPGLLLRWSGFDPGWNGRLAPGHVLLIVGVDRRLDQAQFGRAILGEPVGRGAARIRRHDPDNDGQDAHDDEEFDDCESLFLAHDALLWSHLAARSWDFPAHVSGAGHR